MSFRKKRNISWDYFANHWQHVHADLVLSLPSFKASNILHYAQILQSPTEQQMETKLGYDTLEWDACSEFWVRRIEDFEGFINGEEYKNSLHDVDHFIAVEEGFES